MKTILIALIALSTFGAQAQKRISDTTIVKPIQIVSHDFETLKHHVLLAEEEYWNTKQDIINSLVSKVANFQVFTKAFNQISGLRVRGSDINVIIIDGIRYTDPSILNTLNPRDIEKIKVYPSAIAANRPTISF